MAVTAEYLNYKDTGYFSKLVTDYIDLNNNIKPFFPFNPDMEGILKAINGRKTNPVNRAALVDHLLAQYNDIPLNDKVKKNIDLLTVENTFTVCTAHQPNIFTGHLYFIYKILHTIRLAEHLKDRLPEYNFIPVFYMGNEDADLEELGHIYIGNKKYNWDTKQTGAVGKMIIDDKLIKLIDQISAQVEVMPKSSDILRLLRSCYTKGKTIQNATLQFVNNLFESFGLVILIPGSDILKSTMHDVFKDDLLNHTAHKLVEQTNTKLKENYKPQATSREINLFYLADQVRNKIIKENDQYRVDNTTIMFTKEEIERELLQHPSAFSPNVILRGLYQETILPNIAFIGGGGEIAYWLQLHEVFKHYNVPYPVLIVRNSFLLVDKKAASIKHKLSLTSEDLFKQPIELINALVKKNSNVSLTIEKEKKQLSSIYEQLKQRVETTDSTLVIHIAALQQKALNKIDILEKKLLKAERRKYNEQQLQIESIKGSLFPSNSLQERVENIIPYYATYGKEILNLIYQNSQAFNQQFCVLQLP